MLIYQSRPRVLNHFCATDLFESMVKPYGLPPRKVYLNTWTKDTSCLILRVQPKRCSISQLIYFFKTFYMFQTGFPSIIRSSKLHIQRQVFVRPLLLHAATLARSKYQYWSDKYLTLCVQFWAPDDGRKTRLKHVERLTEINCETLQLVGCTLRVY